MFYITVSNGLLDGDHQKKIGSAVWQFMWCLDKMTIIDSKGEGKVLGGKPIKLSEVQGASERTVSRNLNKLEQLGYIKIIYAPYGMIIRVMKAKKVFQKRSANNGVPILERSDISGVPLTKFGVPNKIIQIDKTNIKSSVEDLPIKSSKEKNMEQEIDIETGEVIENKKPNSRKNPNLGRKELIELVKKFDFRAKKECGAEPTPNGYFIMAKIMAKIKIGKEHIPYKNALDFIDYWFDEYPIKNQEDRQYMTYMGSEIVIKKFIDTL